MADSVRFWWRGRIVDVTDLPAGTTVLEWLRDHAGATGTKEGCNEGDCGACTVVVGRPDAGGERLALHPANACLLLLPMLHGGALVTVEDVADGPDLHPVQRALVDGRGTQCGYCTPGIVMSLWYEAQQRRAGPPPTRADLANRLSGNLCRCTGYQSVLDAAQAALAALAAPAGGGRALPETEILAALAAAAPAAAALDYRAAGTAFQAPTTLAGLVAALDADPDRVLLAGGTDLVLDARLAGRPLPPLVWTGRVRELDTVHRTASHLVIGGAARLEDGWRALAAQAPALEGWWHRFAGPAIRSTGTLAGNLVNGSPIADGTPVLLALDAEVVLVGPGGERRVPLEQFHVGRRETVRERTEVLQRIEVPLTALGRDLRAFKVSRRFDSDISTVSGVFALDLDDATVREVRIVFGGLAPTVRRAYAAEAAVRGQPWSRDTLAAAQDALAADVTPISDHRGSADHRRRTARGLLERWWLQTRPGDPLPAERTEVWAVR